MLVEIIIRRVNRLHLDGDVKLHALGLARLKRKVALNVVEPTPELSGTKVLDAE